MDSTVIQTFRERYEALAGKVHLVPDLAGAVGEIVSILQDRGATRIALAGLPPETTEALAAALVPLGVSVLQEPFPAAGLPAAIDGVDVGITGAAFAIAQSGTLVETVTNDATRLVSSLPRVHIGVVRAQDIVAQFLDAGERLRHLFKEQSAACAVSFISGPSRTGDIEIKLTLGVHGPETAHAVVIGAGDRGA